MQIGDNETINTNAAAIWGTVFRVFTEPMASIQMVSGGGSEMESSIPRSVAAAVKNAFWNVVGPYA